ncbi:aminoglycoside phosphotransferase family protein [Paenibacillus sp. J5C_2022]|uniref:aminoglycoside phosphotransferase family protein n=1 Tax=Paenibacillus sp. J5C2022 TaxID=2977129 RepID=UPI0021CE6353|nr:aminoglycoside phosphotransferase family protein [Paenibacillus sp. J5C2022]MCU6707293.1 aminoglycoside phosphotransferase family protein [Paenibacillus sp. J5C2022]
MTEAIRKGLRSLGYGGLLVLIDFRIGGFDLLPDTIGYLLMASGMFGLNHHHQQFRTVKWLALLLAATPVIHFLITVGRNPSLSNALSVDELIVAQSIHIVHVVMVYLLFQGLATIAAGTGQSGLHAVVIGRRNGYVTVQAIILFVMPFLLNIDDSAAIPLMVLSIAGFIAELFFVMLCFRVANAVQKGIRAGGKKAFSFSQEEKERIVEAFGAAFYQKAIRNIERYAYRWGLSSLRLIPSYSANLVLTCRSALYGKTVLKIGRAASKEFYSEYYALQEYEGSRYCKALEGDFEHGVILLQYVSPGTPLRGEPSLERRLEVFCSLYRDMHREPARVDIYPTYSGWVSKITGYMSTRQDCPDLYAHMMRANDICKSLSETYNRNMLLHGDLHHDNILLGVDGEYRIIDPKGVVGDPLFDIPRFILNEFEDDITPGLEEKINAIIEKLASELKLPDEAIRKCLYVETSMAVCWNIESDAPPEEWEGLLAQAAFAESLMNRG